MNGWDEFDTFVASQHKGHASATLKGIRCYLQSFKRFLQSRGVKSLNDVTDLDSTAFVSALKEKLRPRSVYNCLQAVFGELLKYKQLYPERVHHSVEIPLGKPRQLQCPRINKTIKAELLARIIRACVEDLGLNSTNPIPYLVLLAIRTGINVSSLCSLRYDCLESAPQGAVQLVWSKPRSKGQMRVKLKPGYWGTIEIISQWRTHIKENTPLFGFGGRCVRAAYPIELAKWCSEKNLPHFTIASIRATVASQIYRETRDLYAVQGFLQHSRLDTTLAYINEETRSHVNLELLAKAQEIMYRRVFDGL